MIRPQGESTRVLANRSFERVNGTGSTATRFDV
jgi:hypothetical protein